MPLAFMREDFLVVRIYLDLQSIMLIDESSLLMLAEEKKLSCEIAGGDYRFEWHRHHNRPLWTAKLIAYYG